MELRLIIELANIEIDRLHNQLVELRKSKSALKEKMLKVIYQHVMEQDETKALLLEDEIAEIQENLIKTTGEEKLLCAQIEAELKVLRVEKLWHEVQQEEQNSSAEGKNRL